MLHDLAEKYFGEVREFTEIRYTLADTRVQYVTLTDHLLLTSGLAVAMLKEVLGRGRTAEEICGLSLSSDDLVHVTRIAALLHDVGKVDGYRGHVRRGVQMAREKLQHEELPQSIKDMILRAIERHQLDYSPESLLEKIVCLADSIASAGDRPQLQRETRSYDELAQLAGRTLDLERDTFGDQPGLTLILGDVDRVKSYVFDTSKLPVIRGASEILNKLNLHEVQHIITEHLAPECLIYAGGGSLLALAPSCLVEVLTEAIQTRYLAQTGVATITCVTSYPLRYLDFARGHVPYVDADIKKLQTTATGFGKRLLTAHPTLKGRKRGFGEIIAFLAADLKRAKEAKSAAPVTEALPIARRCTYCGLRPAEQMLEADALCHICDLRRRRGARQGRAEFATDFQEWALTEKDREINIKTSENLDEIAGKSGYVGFIYADGNDIGALLEEKAITPAAFRHIAAVLQRETRAALFESLYETFDGHFEDFSTLPFEIINIGGDDVSLFVQAPWAWEVVLRFLEAFEVRTAELAQELGEPNLTASAGVCLAKKDYPVYYAERLADSLLKKAKGRAKRDRNHYVSSICHLYIQASLAADHADDVLKSYDKSRPARRLTDRPYSITEARRLGQVTEALQKLFSRSQFHALVQALEQGVFASSNFFSYQLSRVMSDDNRECVKILKEAIGLLGYDPQFLIWRWDKTDGLYATCLYDALELAKIQEGRP
jgi:CRISPR-associated protein Cmr2